MGRVWCGVWELGCDAMGAELGYGDIDPEVWFDGGLSAIALL